MHHGFLGFLEKGGNVNSVMLRLTRDLASADDTETLSSNLVHTLYEAFGFESVFLFLPDEAERSYVLRARAGLDSEPPRTTSLPNNHPLIRELLSAGFPVVTGGPGASSTVQKEKIINELRVEVALPLQGRSSLAGILIVLLKQARRSLAEEELQFLAVLANHVAVAIENRGLYESLRQSRQIIRRADRLASLGQLTAGLVHEIRNPLVTIRTFTQLLPERYHDPEFRNDFQPLAMRELNRICGLVNELLRFVRSSAPKVSAEDVNETVNGIAHLLETEAKEKKVEIHRCLAPDLPKILVDKEQIEQVCMNVILNAIQAIEGRGIIEILTRLVSLDGKESFVQVEISDSGAGIAEKDIGAIFDPFFTTKQEGSGLGLSISRQIVQEHGGFIAVESKVGAGAVFLINLPVDHPDHATTKGCRGLYEEDPDG